MTSLAPLLALIGLIGPPDGPESTPEARGLLDDVVRAYRSLATYRDAGRFELVRTIGDATETVAWPAAFALARPNRLSLDAGEARLKADGKTLTHVIGPSKSYLVGRCPPAIGVASVAEGPVGAMLLGGPYSGPARLLLTLLLDDDPAPTILKELRAIRVEPGREGEDPARQALILEPNSGPPLRLRIDPQTRLLSAIELAAPADAFAAKAPAGSKIGGASVSWISGAISTGPVDDDAFAFEPPKAFAKLEAVQVPPDRRPAADRAGHPMVGKPAPEFAFLAIDPDDPAKTKAFNKLDLAGKVVLIDFWATWCGPCLKKMPELDALMTKYADAPDVAIIGLNAEGRGDEPAALRAKIDKALAETKAPLLRHAPGGIVGLDTRMAVSEAFLVEFLPTVVLIDKQGVVRRYRTGAAEETLEPTIADIETLRAGKPLPGEPEAR